MNEKTMLTLLTRLSHQLIELHEKEGKLERRPEFAARLAQATWDGLVFMLRQSIASKETVVLEDLGIFKYDGEKCAFVPAASLVEAEAINLKAEDAHRRLAYRALFYLDQGAAILNVIPQNIGLTKASFLEDGGVEESSFYEALSLSEMFYGLETSTLSAEVRQLAEVLSVRAEMLEILSEAAEVSEPPAEDAVASETHPEATSFVDKLRVTEVREREAGGGSAQLGAVEDT